MEQENKIFAKKIIEEMEQKEEIKRREKMETAKKKLVSARLTQKQYDDLTRRCSANGIKISKFCEEALLIAMHGLAV